MRCPLSLLPPPPPPSRLLLPPPASSSLPPCPPPLDTWPRFGAGGRRGQFTESASHGAPFCLALTPLLTFQVGGRESLLFAKRVVVLLAVAVVGASTSLGERLCPKKRH